MPGELAKNFKETKQPPLKDQYDEWLARVICFAFSIEPTPFIAQVNRATAETAREQSLAEGLAPLQNWIKGLVDYVLAAYMDMPDLEFAWAEEDAVDPLVQAQINVMYVNAGVLSVNEVRSGLGLDAIEEPEPVDPANETSDDKKPDNETDKGKPEGDKDAAYLGGVLKKQSPKTLRLPSAQVLAKARKQFAKATESFLKRVAVDMAAQLSEKLGLTKVDSADDALDDLDWSVWEELAVAAVPSMTLAAQYGAESFLVRLGSALGDAGADLIASIDSHAIAVRYAQQRSAEMVGMKWMDGKLVPNPNATWQITEGMRSQLRGLVSRAIEEGWGADKLADELQGSHSFSGTRARVIARTEIGNAYNEGGYVAAGEAGAEEKMWLTANDEKVSDECVLCGADGWITFESTFSSGVLRPKNHPNCRCTLEVRKKDAWQIEQDAIDKVESQTFLKGHNHETLRCD